MLVGFLRAQKAGQPDPDGTSVFLFRILFLHLAIALAAFAIHALGNPPPAPVFLLVVKMGIELLLSA